MHNNRAEPKRTNHYLVMSKTKIKTENPQKQNKGDIKTIQKRQQYNQQRILLE